MPDLSQHFEIAELAASSPDFRRVLWTGKHAQLVIMNIPPGEDVGTEIHEDTDQILTFIAGQGVAIIGGISYPVFSGELFAVPAGTEHNFRNTGTEPLILYTVYGPAEHESGLVQATKPAADQAVDVTRRLGCLVDAVQEALRAGG